MSGGSRSVGGGSKKEGRLKRSVRRGERGTVGKTRERGDKKKRGGTDRDGRG